MRAELRKSGGHQCESCGAFDLLHVDESALQVDLAPILETEMVRREVRLAQVFRDHLAQVERGYAADLIGREQSALLERGVLVSEMNAILGDMNIDVNPWRVFKAHREKRFRVRVQKALGELYELTQYPFTDPPGQIEASSQPDRS